MANEQRVRDTVRQQVRVKFVFQGYKMVQCQEKLAEEVIWGRGIQPIQNTDLLCCWIWKRPQNAKIKEGAVVVSFEAVEPSSSST